MKGLFEKNLMLLQKKNPLLALRLHAVQPKKGKLENTSIIPQENTEVLYLYGVSSCYQDIKGWLREKSKHKVIFIEDDLDRFSIFLNEPETERLLLDPQVQLIIISGIVEEALREVIWSHLFCSYECLILPGKDQDFATHFSELKMNAEHMMCCYRDYGEPQMKNVFENLKYPAIRGDELQNKLKGVPAIICGAGPSLKKNVELLKDLKNHAVIFAGGSALQPLQDREIVVHFGGSIDPDPPMIRYGSLNCPFFFQNQTSNQLLAKVQGPLIRMGASGCFPLESWLDEESVPFDAGTHVGTFLAHIATFLGCSPIIFVGMDGCCSNGMLYIDKIKEERRKDPFTVLDQFGNRVHSRADFLLGRRWLENLAYAHADTLFLNATEGGLSINGITDICLKKVKEKWLSQHIHVANFLQDFVPTKVDYKLTVLRESMTRCWAYCKNFSFVEQQKLFEEIFYQLVLLPNWNVWRFFLQRKEIIHQMENPVIEKNIQQILFFQDVCKKYEHILPN